MTLTAPANRTGRHAAEKNDRKRGAAFFNGKPGRAVIAGIAAAVVGIGGTLISAILTDHHVVAGHTVARDSFGLTVTGPKLISITHALPGSSDTATITVTNSGTAAADVVGSYTVAAGQNLLDVGGMIVEFTGPDGLPGASGAHTNWTGSHWEVDDLEAGQSVTVTLTLAYDTAIDNTEWAALATSAAFAVNVDGQQAANPGSGVSVGINWNS